MPRFRVLQFNMQFGQGWDPANPDGGAVDLEATIREIRTHAADVILLQEVEQAQAGGSHPYPPPNYQRLRSALTEYDSYFSYPRPDVRELPFGIGLAIFSRTPLQEAFREELPSPPVSFEFQGRSTTPTDRLLIGAWTEVGGVRIGLLNTHLLAFFMLNSSSEQHGEQRRRVADRLKQARGPTILGGDFNVSRHESLIAQFAGVGFRTVQSTEVTWRRRPYVLDHLFYNEPLRCVDHRVVPTPTSDHHALVADFVL